MQSRSEEQRDAPILTVPRVPRAGAGPHEKLGDDFRVIDGVGPQVDPARWKRQRRGAAHAAIRRRAAWSRDPRASNGGRRGRPSADGRLGRAALRHRTMGHLETVERESRCGQTCVDAGDGAAVGLVAATARGRATVPPELRDRLRRRPASEKEPLFQLSSRNPRCPNTFQSSKGSGASAPRAIADAGEIRTAAAGANSRPGITRKRDQLGFIERLLLKKPARTAL